MTKKTRDAPRPDESLTEDEVERADGEPLPDREAMSIVTVPTPQPVVPIHPGDATIDPPPPEQA